MTNFAIIIKIHLFSLTLVGWLFGRIFRDCRSYVSEWLFRMKYREMFEKNCSQLLFCTLLLFHIKKKTLSLFDETKIATCMNRYFHYTSILMNVRYTTLEMRTKMSNLKVWQSFQIKMLNMINASWFIWNKDLQRNLRIESSVKLSKIIKYWNLKTNGQLESDQTTKQFNRIIYFHN